MKKLFYLFLLLPFSFLMGCNDDKDLSPVDFTLTLSGVTLDNGCFYTVAGNDISIRNLEAKSLDGRDTGVQNVTFYLDGIPMVGDMNNPFEGTFTTEDLPAGTYSLGVMGMLLQVDSSIRSFAINYTLIIVDSEEDLPAGAPELGTYSQTLSMREK